MDINSNSIPIIADRAGQRQQSRQQKPSVEGVNQRKDSRIKQQKRDKVLISPEAQNKLRTIALKKKQMRQAQAQSERNILQYVVYKIAPGYHEVSVSYEINYKGNQVKASI